MAGEYPRNLDDASSQTKLANILNSGITSFLDLTGEADRLAPYHQWLEARAQHHRFWIPDMDIPPVPQMRAILDHLQSELDAGHNVYVHCWGGIGRTGTVMGCHWVEQGLTGEQALDRIAGHWRQMAKKSRFPRSPQTDSQVDFVRTWSAK